MDNNFEISCELLETLRRISATITCTKCQPITITGDSPIIVSDLIAGQYTIEMKIADSAEINDTVVEIITVSDKDKSISSIVVNSTIVDMITTSTSNVTIFVSPTNMQSTYICMYCIYVHEYKYVPVLCTLYHVHSYNLQYV